MNSRTTWLVAPAKRPARPAGAADMKHRQADEVGHAGRQQPGLGPQRKHPGEVGVGELRALGQAGRAAGIELHGGVAGPDRQMRIVGGLPVAPFGEGLRRHHGGRQRPRSCVPSSAHRGSSRSRESTLAHEQDLGLGIVEDVRTSGGARRQLTETITALALAAPNSSSKKMSVLLSRWATRACGLIPWAISPLATRLEARSSAA